MPRLSLFLLGVKTRVPLGQPPSSSVANYVEPSENDIRGKGVVQLRPTGKHSVPSLGSGIEIPQEEALGVPAAWTPSLFGS